MRKPEGRAVDFGHFGGPAFGPLFPRWNGKTVRDYLHAPHAREYPLQELKGEAYGDDSPATRYWLCKCGNFHPYDKNGHARL